MKRLILLFPSLLIFFSGLFAQNSCLYAGVDFPLYYSLGYQQRLSSHFSMSGQAGLMTKPFDVLILNTVKIFDDDEVLLNTIGEAFSSGVSLQAKVNWHIKKSYLGVTYSFLTLTAKDCPADAIQNYYGYNIPSRRAGELELQSYFHNAGLLYGRAFQFKNPAMAIHAEISILKTFASSTILRTGGGEDLLNLSKAIDQELNSYYLEYGVLPSINLYFDYNFHSK